MFMDNAICNLISVNKAVNKKKKNKLNKFIFNKNIYIYIYIN